jgi:hypothetical protein
LVSMKKNSLTFIVFILIGLLAAGIITSLLEPVDGLSFLLRSSDISWHPKADLNFLQYDLFFQVKLNLISLLTIAAAIWIYRKL